MAKRQLQSIRLQGVEVLGAKFNPGSEKKLPSVKADVATLGSLRQTMLDLMEFSQEGRGGASWDISSHSGYASLRHVYLTGCQYVPGLPSRVKVGIEVVGDIEDAMMFFMRAGSEPGGDWSVVVTKDFFDSVPAEVTREALDSIPPAEGDGTRVTISAEIDGEHREVETDLQGLQHAAEEAGRRRRGRPKRQEPETPPGKSRVDLPPPTPEEMQVTEGGTVDTRTGAYVRDCIYTQDGEDIDGDDVPQVA